jgi:group I intron endonuclease
MKNNYGQIYLIINNITYDVYVGQTTRSLEIRLNEHFDTAIKDKDERRLYRAIRKYGKENFSIKQIGQAVDKKSLDTLEIYYIAFYRQLLDKNKVYNLTEGGEGRVGPISEQGKANMRKPHGPMTREHKASIGKAQRGKSRGPKSKNHKEKIGQSVIKLWEDPVYRQHMIEAHKHPQKKKKGPLSEEHKNHLKEAWVLRKQKAENGQK